MVNLGQLRKRGVIAIDLVNNRLIYRENILDMVRLLMDNKGYTISELARDIDIDRATVTKLFNGTIKMSNKYRTVFRRWIRTHNEKY